MDPKRNQQLYDVQAAVQIRPIPWQGYSRANFLSPSAATLFTEIERMAPDARDAAVAASMDEYVGTIVSLLRTSTPDDVVKFIALLLNELTAHVDGFADRLMAEPDAWALVASLLDQQDEQTAILGFTLFAMLSQDHDVRPEYLAKAFGAVGKRFLPSGKPLLQDMALQALTGVLQTIKYRGYLWQENRGVVEAVLRMATTVASGLQLQYHGLLALWLLSFEAKCALGMVSSLDSVANLLDVTKNSPKEKIVRVAIAILVNFVRLARSAAVKVLVSQRGIPVVSALAERKWTDDELREDLQFLEKTLQESFELMTTMDVYCVELDSRHLAWSPPHRNASFWRENIDSFRKENWKLLRRLLTFVESPEPLSQAVVCNDIAAILKEAPEANEVLAREGVKPRIMQLLNSPNSEVRFEALKATQAIINNAFK